MPSSFNVHVYAPICVWTTSPLGQKLRVHPDSSIFLAFSRLPLARKAEVAFTLKVWVEGKELKGKSANYSPCCGLPFVWNQVQDRRYLLDRRDEQNKKRTGHAGTHYLCNVAFFTGLVHRQRTTGWKFSAAVHGNGIPVERSPKSWENIVSKGAREEAEGKKRNFPSTYLYVETQATKNTRLLISKPRRWLTCTCYLQDGLINCQSSSVGLKCGVMLWS